ncbi:UV-endonuclease UvdE-domain-containing protein [Astrocystis sublimbata]|nr:UV-endonuclease UvdE-domain-containing protein [Astrocystis sublimbata]
MCGNIRRLALIVESNSGHRLGHIAPAYSKYIPGRLPVARVLPRSLTMGQKRKKSSMALMPPNNQMDGGLTSALMADGPRRSGRLVDKGDQRPRSQPKGDVVAPVKSRTPKSKSKPAMASTDENVDVALNKLQEMEDQLRNEVKRQKKVVQESEVKATEIDEEHAALMQRNIKADPDVLAPGNLSALTKGLKPGVSAPYGVEEDGKSGDREDADEALEKEDINAVKLEGARPPPVNSDYLPLPWKGRLGYACLNTYLRNCNPPVFCSRTCRMSSIVDHRHPLQDPSQPEHATKNRPDKDQPPDIARGQRYVEALGLANTRDLVKMLRWNDKYGIKFLRLSSEMFPFASHELHGYKLAPFASEALAEAGKVAAELGHRLTTHPGQFTQLGSPRNEVVKSAVRDLEYHNEMLSLLRLPEQLNKDAVMILHMGGVFGDKGATLDRFRENYDKLSNGIKARLVLENDDVSWTVHDLLPICEELNIPMVLDFHHHNIMFDKDKIREGTKDIMDLYPRIKATWERKGITQKMHYSEPCSEAVTGRQRRKHRPRVMTLPPCADTMDLMIEAKDKEQAVFDLMRNFRLPGWDSFNDVVPYEREDENRPAPKAPKKKATARKRKAKDDADAADEAPVEEPPEPKPKPEVPEAELGMGGPENRVYWPLGMEEYLRPKKREIKKKPAANGKGGSANGKAEDDEADED